MEVIQKKQPTNVKEEVKENYSSKELVKRQKVENSPFEIITINGESFGTMGEYRLTEKGNSIEEVKKELEEITWNRIIQIVMILEEIREKVNKTNKK